MQAIDQLTYIATCIFAAATPGPGTISVIHCSMRFGFKRTLPLIIGIQAGLGFVALLSMCGIIVLISTSKVLFYTLQFIGGLYLFYLGIACISSAFKGQSINQDKPKMQPFSFVAGYMMSVFNPKTLIFFSALFPAFIDPQQGLLKQNLYLTAILLLSTLSVHFCYAKIGQYSARFLMAHQTKIDLLSGVIFILLAIYILLGSSI